MPGNNRAVAQARQPALSGQPQKLAEMSIQAIRRSLEFGTSASWLKNDSFVPFLMYLLSCDGNTKLQAEAAWIFTNIAAGPNDQTKLIVDRGIVPRILRLLKSPSDEVVEQAIWTIGNIIGDDVTYRDLLIDHGIIPDLLALDLKSKNAQFRRTFIWVVVNLVRNKTPPISLDLAKSLIPTINSIVIDHDNLAKIDALWALTYMADCNEEFIQAIIDSGIVRTIVPMLSNHRYKIQQAAMRMLGNIATGTDEQTEVLLTNDILLHIRFPLMHPREGLRRMALWCMSNITVGTSEQIQAVFDSGLLNRIVEGLSRQDMKTRREALFTVNNLINFGRKEQVLDIINAGAINPLFQLLLALDEETALTATKALNTLFSKSSQLVDKYAELYARLMRSPS